MRIPRPATKTWWRNLADGPTEIGVLLDGRWQQTTAEVLRPGDAAYDDACATYHKRFPRPVIAGGPVVRLEPVASRRVLQEEEGADHV